MHKLLLFDIDGTLITGHGIPKKVALDVFRRYFPDFKKGEDLRFNGMTDPLIIKELLASNDHHITMDDPIITKILDDFVLELKHFVNPQIPPSVLPGVSELLNICYQDKYLHLGLVTGNVQQGAEVKLVAAGLFHYFEVGAYGSDHWNRNVLPPIAIKRAEKSFGINFSERDIWIIGDSTRDVECARENGLNCLAVETGNIPANILRQAGADIVVSDLSNTNKIVEFFKA